MNTNLKYAEAHTSFQWYSELLQQNKSDRSHWEEM